MQRSVHNKNNKTHTRVTQWHKHAHARHTRTHACLRTPTWSSLTAAAAAAVVVVGGGGGVVVAVVLFPNHPHVHQVLMICFVKK